MFGTYLCLWSVISTIHEFTWIIIKISLTFKAQSNDWILSKITSGNGKYVSLSGNLSWTNDNEIVASIKLIARVTNAEKFN